MKWIDFLESRRFLSSNELSLIPKKIRKIQSCRYKDKDVDNFLGMKRNFYGFGFFSQQWWIYFEVSKQSFLLFSKKVKFEVIMDIDDKLNNGNKSYSKCCIILFRS